MQANSVQQRTDAHSQDVLASSVVSNVSRSRIDAVSDDILAYIFEVGSRGALDAREGLAFALLVSSVSSRWRSISLSTAAVWTNIPIYNGLPSYVTNWDLIQLLLDRSGPVLPLNVYVHVGFGPRQRGRAIMEDLNEMSEELVTRCETISIIASPGGDGQLLFRTLGKRTYFPSMALLRKLVLYDSAVDINAHSFKILVLSCPNLASLEVRNVRWSIARPIINDDAWSDDDDAFSDDIVLSLGVYDDDDDASPDDPDSMPTLWDMDERVDIIFRSGAFLLDKPSLREISVSGGGHHVLEMFMTSRLDRVHIKAAANWSLDEPVKGKHALATVQTLTLELADKAHAAPLLETICAMPSLTKIVSLHTSCTDLQTAVIPSNLEFPPLEIIEFHGTIWPERLLRPVVEGTAGTLKTVTVKMQRSDDMESQRRAILKDLGWIRSPVDVCILAPEESA